MKILTVAGKIDSRALVYPLARALSLSGAVGIITDDGCYRRLFNGKSNIGSVNGIDISVVNHVDEAAVHSLDNSGINYDYLILVSSDYIHSSSNGVIACHGLDRTVVAKSEEDEDDDFIIPMRKDNQEDKKEVEPDNAKASKKKAKGKQSKKAAAAEEEVRLEDPEVTNLDYENRVINPVADSSDSGGAVESEVNPVTVETEHDRMIRLQAENPDGILIPDGMQYTEVQIAYAPVPKRGMPGIALKDGICSYIYSCEEKKRLEIMSDKAICQAIAKVASPLLGIGNKELEVYMSKEEGAGAPVKAKKGKGAK